MSFRAFGSVLRFLVLRASLTCPATKNEEPRTRNEERAMSDDLQIEFDTRRFNHALSVWFAKSKKTNQEILEQQAKLFVKEVVQMTPPHKPGKNTNASGNHSTKLAQKAGEGSVESDLNRLFFPVKKSEAQYSNLISIHNQHRNPRGRVKKGIGKKHKVWKTDFTRYLKSQKDQVGRLAAGWNEAARKFGWNPPVWISRHNSPGSAKVSISGDSLKVEMTNAVSYASGQKGLESRMRRALKAKERDLIKQIKHRMGEDSPFR